MNAVTTQPQSTALSTYSRVQNVAEFISMLGTDIAKSNFFGCQSLEQGRVLATECLAMGLPPMSLARRFDIIHGKLSMKSQAMLTDLRQVAGWKSEKIEKTPEVASIRLVSPEGKEYIETLTWDELKKEPVPYEGKEQAIVDQLAKGETPKLKAKYATPRSRANMMWNRLVSDAVRTHCPEIVCGMYTPEEIEDFTGKPLPEPTDENGQVVEGEYEVVDGTEAGQVTTEQTIEVTVETTETVESTTSPDSPCTDDQRTRIQDLFVEFKVSYEAQQGILNKRNASVLRNLTVSQADELIAKFEDLREQTKSEPSSEPDTRTSAAETEPCTEPQVEAIKEAMRQAAQVSVPDIGSRVKDLLKRNGIEKLNQLSLAEADALRKLIETKNVEAFVELTLAGYGQSAKASTEAVVAGN